MVTKKQDHVVARDQGIEGVSCASGREDPPVGDGLQGTAVAAGQPE